MTNSPPTDLSIECLLKRLSATDCEGWSESSVTKKWRRCWKPFGRSVMI